MIPRMRSTLLTAALTMIALSFAPAANAFPFSYTSVSSAYDDIGNTQGDQHGFDKLQLNGVSGTLSALGTYVIADVVFSTGNTGTDSLGNTYSIGVSQTLTIDGVTHTITQQFTDLVGWFSDYGSLAASPPVEYDLPGGTRLTVTALGLQGSIVCGDSVDCRPAQPGDDAVLCDPSSPGCTMPLPANVIDCNPASSTPCSFEESAVVTAAARAAFADPAIPEPASALLLAGGLSAFGLIRHGRRVAGWRRRASRVNCGRTNQGLSRPVRSIRW